MTKQDNALAFDLLDILMKNNMDYTRSFRALSHVKPKPIYNVFA
jgi:uncharacterized protein YdiU (UPF0061 family)